VLRIFYQKAAEIFLKYCKRTSIDESCKLPADSTKYTAEIARLFLLSVVLSGMQCTDKIRAEYIL